MFVGFRWLGFGCLIARGVLIVLFIVDCFVLCVDLIVVAVGLVDLGFCLIGGVVVHFRSWFCL